MMHPPRLHPFDVIATWDRAHGTRLVLIMEDKHGRYIGFPLSAASHEAMTDITFRESDWQTVFTPPKHGAVCFHRPIQISPDFLTRRVARLDGPVQNRLRAAYRLAKLAWA